MEKNRDRLDIAELIESEKIEMYYQPIVSIRKNAVIGFEALVRGKLEDEVILPEVLFHLAAESELTVELDRLCRKKGMEGFARFIAENPRFKDCILFLNFEASIIDQGVVGSGQLMSHAEKFGLNPHQIAIEIVESKVNDVQALKKFIDIQREHGFIIALDDIGTGYSNLNRLSIVKPDILKIDSTIVSNIHGEFYKQEVFKSLANLSKKIGAMVVAEGIESDEEAIMSLNFGADMLQGFYFAYPGPFSAVDQKEAEAKNEDIAARLKDHILDSLQKEAGRKQELNIVINKAIFELSLAQEQEYNEKLSQLVNLNKNVECIYILDASGVQVSDTVFNPQKISKQKN